MYSFAKVYNGLFWQYNQHFTLTQSPLADLCRGLSHASEIHREQTSEPLHLPDLDAQGFYTQKKRVQAIALMQDTHLGFTERKKKSEIGH